MSGRHAFEGEYKYIRNTMQLQYKCSTNTGMHLKCKEERVANRRHLLCNPVPPPPQLCYGDEEENDHDGHCRSCQCSFH